MRRKIIKQGHNTMTITLPSKWVKQFNLDQGKEIDLIEKEDGLFLTTEKINGKPKKITLNLEGKDIPTIWKYFMAIYREGYDEVLVKFNPNTKLEYPDKFYVKRRLDYVDQKSIITRPVSEVMQHFVNRFIGFEIIEHGKDFVLIKEMGELTNKEFHNSLRRVFLSVQEMIEKVLESIQNNNKTSLNHIHDADINLDKFHDFCIRILNKTEYGGLKKSSLYFSTLYLLELLGDELKNIAVHLIDDFPTSKLKNLRELAESVKEEFDKYYQLFYKFDEEKVNQFSKIDREIYMRVPKMYKKASEEEKEIFHHLRMIGRYLNALIELRIELEV